MQQETDIRSAPIELWRIAAWFLDVLHALFGAPETIAERSVLSVRAHSQLASWLRVGEALMRRLLLIEAAAYPEPNARPPLYVKRRRVRRVATFTHDKPEDWRVSFRCFARCATVRQARRDAMPPREDGAGPNPRSNDDAFRRFHSAWPLAERYEALLRVFNAPQAYARRLARRLHVARHRLDDVLCAPAEYAHRVDRAQELTEQAQAPWRGHLDSS